MNKIKSIIFTVAASLGLMAPLAIPAATHAQVDVNENLCAGANFDVTATCADNDGAGASVSSLIVTVINIFSLVVGVVAVIMIIVGGVKYITSGGDAGNVTGAKNTILYAVIGLVIVAIAQLLVRFVLQITQEGTAV